MMLHCALNIGYFGEDISSADFSFFIESLSGLFGRYKN